METGGLSLAITSGGLIIELGVDASFYDRSYVTRSADANGNLGVLKVAEQKIDFDATVGYELIHLMSKSVAERFNLTPFLGPAGRFLVNPDVPTNLFGPEVGARIAVAASSALVFTASYGFTPNVLSNSVTPLLEGTPRFDHVVDLELSLRLSGSARVRVAYLSEYMTMSADYRSYQSIGIGFDYGF
jgi:hypothetical protein